MLASCAQTGAWGPRDEAYFDRIVRAHLAGSASGRLAAEKAHSAQVRRLARRIAESHVAMLREITAISTAQGVTIPVAPDDAHRRALKKLEASKGRSFDRAYLERALEDQQQALELLELAAEQASHRQLKDHARKAITSLREQRDAAERLSKQGG